MKEVLKNLSTYEPPHKVWEAIESRLPLLEMPLYEPPMDIWNSIENQLVEPENRPFPINNYPFILRGVKNIYWLALAASIALFIAVSMTLYFNKKQEITVAITTETLDNKLLNQDWQEADKDFALVEEFCKTVVQPCEEPEFKNLKNELEELNKAREDLKNALNTYNSDADMVAQLSKLENERSDILKKMIDKM
jgi:6-pyruvoyl-tetrahydropterin synthase